jgi:hypothetical protein
MYFEKFPTIAYPYRIGGKNTLKPVADITFNVRFRKEILENVALYDEYDIKDGETPEIIAARVYGNPQYHWVIMLANQRYNYAEDFPKSQRVLEDYVKAKYQEPYGVHHYENEQGYTVMESTPGAYPVSNYEYEDRLNESKRRIKLISPQTLTSILAEYNVI